MLNSDKKHGWNKQAKRLYVTSRKVNVFNYAENLSQITIRRVLLDNHRQVLKLNLPAIVSAGPHCLVVHALREHIIRLASIHAPIFQAIPHRRPALLHNLIPVQDWLQTVEVSKEIFFRRITARIFQGPENEIVGIIAM